MDVCQAMDTHNDLPYTYVKYQDGAAPTEKNIGVHMDQSHNDLYSDEILGKTRNDSHTSNIKYIFLIIYKNFSNSIDERRSIVWSILVCLCFLQNEFQRCS